MALPERREQLVLLLDYALACGARPLIIGNGTNLLVADQGLDRLVIDTSSALNRTGPGEQPIHSHGRGRCDTGAGGGFCL